MWGVSVIASNYGGGIGARKALCEPEFRSIAGDACAVGRDKRWLTWRERAPASAPNGTLFAALAVLTSQPGMTHTT